MTVFSWKFININNFIGGLLRVNSVLIITVGAKKKEKKKKRLGMVSYKDRSYFFSATVFQLILQETYVALAERL